MPVIPAEARRAIVKGVYRGDAVALLELLGLSQRIINLLEQSQYRIVTLEELVSRSREELLQIHSLGESSLFQIVECLSRYQQLDEIYTRQDAMIRELARQEFERPTLTRRRTRRRRGARTPSSAR